MNETGATLKRGDAHTPAAGRPAGRRLSDFCGRFIELSLNKKGREELAAFGAGLAAGAGSGRLTSNADFCQTRPHKDMPASSALASVLQNSSSQAGSATAGESSNGLTAKGQGRRRFRTAPFEYRTTARGLSLHFFGKRVAAVKRAGESLRTYNACGSDSSGNEAGRGTAARLFSAGARRPARLPCAWLSGFPGA